MVEVLNPARPLASRDFPEVLITEAPTDYALASEKMLARVEAIKAGSAGELLWFLEHPPLITLGTSAKASDVLEPRFPVFKTGRGGQATYHGPGQLILYMMLDLKKRGPDVRAFVRAAEAMIIAALADFDIAGFRREGRVGVWVEDPASPSGESKIAALGVRLSHWVTFHGLSININPDLSHYRAIVPCGIREHGVTSLAARGSAASREAVTKSLLKHFRTLF